MDSLTHIALGACIGEAFFERGFGKKALFWGALAQSVPDVDFLSGFWMNTSDNLLAHRGFTHSICFAVLVIPLLAMTAEKIHRPHNISFRTWTLFFAIEILLHIFIDGFNNYGVGWFEPFSHLRFSFNTIYVADPFFSVWAGIAFVMLIALKQYSRWRGFWWKFGVIIPFLYLGYCCFNKLTVDRDVKEILKKQNVTYTRYLTTPAPLQSWLWFVVAGSDSGYNVGYRSVFDSKKEINFQFFPRNDSLLKPISNQQDLQKLIRFSRQFYTIEKWGDTLVFNDLRFGQVVGWANPGERFVFHYYLEKGYDNKLVVQRGRFAKWDWNAARDLIRRIRGD